VREGVPEVREFSGGIHGQTFVSSDLGRTWRFLVEVLGLRLVKRTVHHHDERLPVHYFGFGDGAGGSDGPVVGYVEWNPIFYALPEAGLVDRETTRAATRAARIGDNRGRWGVGTNHHLALRVPSRDALLKWKRRLQDHGVHVTGPYDRNFFWGIYFRDPDGAILEMAVTDDVQASRLFLEGGAGGGDVASDHVSARDETLVGVRSENEVAAETWHEPVTEIGPEMALQGFHHVTSVGSDADRTTEFYVEGLGIDLIRRTDYLDADGTHYYYSVGPKAEPGQILTFFGFPDHEPGRLGAGLAHHFSLAATDEDALHGWREEMLRRGVAAGEVQDHHYYKGFYLRDPDGHLVLVATPPDFLRDEDADGLGGRLCLPEHLEGRRAQIEGHHRLRPAPTSAASAAPALDGSPVGR